MNGLIEQFVRKVSTINKDSYITHTFNISYSEIPSATMNFICSSYTRNVITDISKTTITVRTTDNSAQGVMYHVIGY